MSSTAASPVTDFKLSPEEKAAWLEALRSGKYKQTKNQLCRSGFCCLGVFADAVKRVDWIPCNDPNSGYFKLPGHQGLFSHHLPEEWIPKGVTQELAQMNDNRGHSFLWIADWIEANL